MPCQAGCGPCSAVNRIAAEGEQLVVEQRLGISHRSAGPPRDHLQRIVVGLHSFAGNDVTQSFHDARRADAGEVEALAARQDGDRDFLDFRGRKNET